MSTVAIVSGGMDSVTMAHLLAKRGGLVILSFDYGQRHARELEFARRCAERIGASWDLVDLSDIARLLTGSSLTDRSVEVPDGHYAAESMRATVVPNRNAIMLNVAVAVAVAKGASAVATAVHAGDHAIYPDCRPAFLHALHVCAMAANEGFIDPGFAVVAPFVEMTKGDIAAVGDGLGVPWAETWSCYKGGERHCGRCGTCTERREAFELAGVCDPTEYEPC